MISLDNLNRVLEVLGLLLFKDNLVLFFFQYLLKNFLSFFVDQSGGKDN